MASNSIGLFYNLSTTNDEMVDNIFSNTIAK